jgi:antagonist of KipI
VGNPPGAAALEATVLGPELRFERPARIAIAGADLSASADGKSIARNSVHTCAAGSVLRFGERTSGARAYIAFDGGIDVPQVLGSRATHAVSGLGGIDGRALNAGDHLALGPENGVGGHFQRTLSGNNDLQRHAGGARLRVMRGPQDDFFDERAFDWLQSARFTISPQSDRMGYRLVGSERTRPALEVGSMISDATVMGGLQIPPSGDPILLMADRQTTGGYPQIATVITADLPLAGQLAPGDWIEFALCTRADAIAALRRQEGTLRQQEEALRGI